MKLIYKTVFWNWDNRTIIKLFCTITMISKIYKKRIKKVRNGIIEIPLKKLEIEQRCHSFDSIRMFNKLNVEHKCLDISKKPQKLVLRK